MTGLSFVALIVSLVLRVHCGDAILVLHRPWRSQAEFLKLQSSLWPSENTSSNSTRRGDETGGDQQTLVVPQAVRQFKDRAQSTGVLETAQRIADQFAKFTKRVSKGRSPTVTRKAAQGLTNKKRTVYRGPRSLGWKKTTGGSLGAKQTRKSVLKYPGRRTRPPLSQLTKKAAGSGATRATGLTKRLSLHHRRTSGILKRRFMVRRPNHRLLSRTGTRVLKRVGRGVLIALPVIGGLAALWAIISDLKRLLEEYERPASSSWACTLFVGAMAADYGDMLCQSFIIHSLFQHESPHLLVTESISTACAVASTVCAVGGEIVSHKHDTPEDP